MRLSLYAIIAGIANLVSAQANAAEPPKCGMNIMISAISSSGCGITEMECMCKNTNLIKKIQKEIPAACKKPTDQSVFSMFFNLQCIGKPGFPIALGAVNKDGTINANATSTSDGRSTRMSIGALMAAGGIALALS